MVPFMQELIRAIGVAMHLGAPTPRRAFTTPAGSC